MADSPVAVASSPRLEAHQESESESDFDDLAPRTDSDHELKTTLGADVASVDAGEEDSDGDQGAASVKTTTAELFPEHEDVPSGPESKQHKLGLDINEPWGWDGSLYNDYDVVTVHGIRDDYRTAWTDAKGVWWVKDDLFQGRSVREIDYSYEIDAESALYEPNGIMQHAQRLITALATLRQKLQDTETDRPVLWICHDLGGTIVKEALYLAMRNPAKYGKIAILTTAIIFLGTPHRFQSRSHLEDQLCKLVLLPGPDIGDRTLSKVRELGRQVTEVNQRFLATKIPDRATIFNVFTQNERESQKQGPNDENTVEAMAANPGGRDGEDVTAGPVTPFPRYAHHLGHSFEAVGRILLRDIDHLTLVRGRGERGGKSDDWFPWLSGLFTSHCFPLRVHYRILQFQTWLLSLVPPTRVLDTSFDPSLPTSPVIGWIREQDPYTRFSKLGAGPRFLHFHGNGNRLLDISKVSRLFYLDHDCHTTVVLPGSRKPSKSVLYFEFDQHDSRYNNISSLLLYMLNAFVWRFWESGTFTLGLEFLSHLHVWSLEDLFHLYSTFRRCQWGDIAAALTIFISCFDQCPAEQRQWFMERVLEEQSYSDSEYRIIVSTSSQDDLLVGASVSDDTRINLDDCPALAEPRDSLTDELRSSLSSLIARRPIYEDFRAQLESLLEQCDNVPYLGRIVLAWLGIHHRGKPRSEIADKISKLSPPTAENIVRVFIDSLAPTLRTRAETVYNWIKNAAEPWSPESLTEALAVRELAGGEPFFEDLDVQGTMGEIEESFGGIVILRDGDVKFSHASFYRVPELGFEESGPEAAARANSTIAETCLRYFQLSCAQEALVEFSQTNLSPVGVPWTTPVNAAVVCHPRTSMAEYAVRFWHQHYKSSGKFKPRKLVNDLFASKEARAGWEVSFWLFSNPFFRMQRSYISALPVLAMLGLEDLVQETVQTEKGRPTFEKDCWYAITEAARAGRESMVQQLLVQVAVDEKELQVALHWAAGRGDTAIVNILLNKIPNVETFDWPDYMMYQAAAAGLNDLLAAMLLSGCDINENSDYTWGATPAVILAWRSHVSTMEFLLSSELKPDLSITDLSTGNTVLLQAVDRGRPRMVELLVQGGADVETKDSNDRTPVQRAANACNHKALDVLIRAGASFGISHEDDGNYQSKRTPLMLAAGSGSEECVRMLLAHGADPNARLDDGETALYEAVRFNHLGVARQLLTHHPKPDMDLTDQGRLLVRAAGTKNAELVTLLLDHCAEVDFADPTEIGFSKTPLSQACNQGSLEIAELLLAKGADINYTGDISDSPLVSALNDDKVEVARYLLESSNLDVKWAASDGTTALHVADEPSLITELLKKGAPIDGHSIYYGTALHRAAKRNRPDVIEALLANEIKPEVDYVYGDDAWDQDFVGLTPLQLACKDNLLKSIRSLLKGGASPKFKNQHGDDAVDILIRTESDSKDALECLRLLLSAPYSVPVNQVDEQGRTRLHAIREETPVSVIQLLLETNAPLDFLDQDGHSPLSLAVNKGNRNVAKYLVKQGANVNRCDPSFGSILHLAVTKGDLDMARLLVNAGADLKAVDPEYGESLLYAALGIETEKKMQRMVRYLVDEAGAPINEPGGVEFGYPIIRAASRARTNPESVNILNFLIRRKALLEVADSQGRRAIHIACASPWTKGLEVIVRAGAKVDVKDALGRKPIHFAASEWRGASFSYLTDTFKEMDVDETDNDNWNPLMWAARTGSGQALGTLVFEKGIDLRARRGCGPDGRSEWSALKMLNFSRKAGLLGRMRRHSDHSDKPDDETEKDEDAFHEVEGGDMKGVPCNSCFANILGIQWKCLNCDDFSLCFKCARRQSTVHNAEHEFDEIGPLYNDCTPSPALSAEYHSDDDELQVHDTADVEDSGDGAGSPRPGSPSSEDFRSEINSSDGEN